MVQAMMIPIFHLLYPSLTHSSTLLLLAFLAVDVDDVGVDPSILKIDL